MQQIQISIVKLVKASNSVNTDLRLHHIKHLLFVSDLTWLTSVEDTSPNECKSAFKKLGANGYNKADMITRTTRYAQGHALSDAQHSGVISPILCILMLCSARVSSHALGK